jgi:transcriptional regulator with XRE-family HTH domain
MILAGVNTSLRKRFGLRVKELRKASGLSQEEFADRSGFARSYMSRIERGLANVSLDGIEILAVALKAEVSNLFVSEPVSSTDVPYASDGSCFNPSLKRPEAGTYGVGEKGKGNTKYFERYEDALVYLRAMPVAKWWRPNKVGNWSLVSAVRWGVPPDQDS